MRHIHFLNSRSLLLSALLSATVFLNWSCRKSYMWGLNGKGDNVTIFRDASHFTGIKLSAEADVIYVQDSEYRIEITGQQNILDVLKTETNGDNLEICFRRNVWRHNKVTILIHSPEIENLQISGSGRIISESAVKTGDLKLKISGSGNIRLSSLSTDVLEANISGSGNIKISDGNTGRSDFRISGSGDIDALQITSVHNTSKISGSGNILTRVTESLDVHISGSGDVKYKGRPVIDSHISGSGSLVSLGE